MKRSFRGLRYWLIYLWSGKAAAEASTILALPVAPQVDPRIECAHDTCHGEWDPRCEGGNCTNHCFLYCRGMCVAAGPEAPKVRKRR